MITKPRFRGLSVFTLAVGILHPSPLIAEGPEPAPDAPDFTRGFLLRDVWTNIPGPGLADLKGATRFPDAPDVKSVVTSFETISSDGDHYGVRLTGWLLPPVTGQYRFYLASNDEGELQLSSDETPAHRRVIAREPSWSGQREWIDSANQESRGSPPVNVSEPILLAAGQRYYVEALMVDGSGGDHLAVAWQKPGDPVPANFSQPIPGTYLGIAAAAEGRTLSITEHPHDASVPDHQAATFTVRATGSTRERFFQWQRNGADIPGASGRTYSTPPVTAADNGARYRCVVSEPGLTTASAEAVLTVIADTTPPTLLEAKGNTGLNQVALTFSEPIDLRDAVDASRFSVSGGLIVLSARPSRDGRVVVLETPPQTEGAEYAVLVHGVRDQSAIGNEIAPGALVRFFAWEPEEFVGPFSSWADAKRDFGAAGDGIADDTEALQRALDHVGKDAAAPTTNDVLWLPAGTYRITRPLSMITRGSVSVFGEDPATTRIKWDGPEGGIMFTGDGVVLSRFGRLTWDGSGRADTAFLLTQEKGRLQVTAIEQADQVFEDLRFGLRVNPASGGDTVTVRRCRFLRCSQAGVSLESFNAVDWRFWDCVFEDCRHGIRCFGGSCHVYDSHFLRSSEVDIFATSGADFGIRRNVSIGSRAFLLDGGAVYSIPFTLVGNTILDPLSDTPIVNGTRGPLVFLDNTVLSREGQARGPVVRAANNLFAMGNTFDVENALSSGGRIIALDNHVVARAQIPRTPPTWPGVAVRRTRPVFEVGSGADTSSIQAAINQAATFTGQRPIVHLAPGQYQVTQTLYVPPRVDLQLVGDGPSGSSLLKWSGDAQGPVLRLEGPTQARIRGVTVFGNGPGDSHVPGIVVDHADQPGARVYLDQVNLRLTTEACLRLDRLRETLVRGDTVNLDVDRGVGIDVIGSGDRATAGRLSLYGSESGGGDADAVFCRIRHGGRVMLQDLWFEGMARRFVRLDEPAELIVNGANLAMADPNHGGDTAGIPTLDFAAAADVSLVNVNLTVPGAYVRIDAQVDPGLAVLSLGLHGRPDSWKDSSLDADVLRALPHSPGPESDLDIPASESLDLATLRRLLERLRFDTPEPLTRKPTDTTDVRMDQVLVDWASVAMLIAGANAAPSLTDLQRSFTVGEGTTLIVTNLATDPDLPYNRLSFRLSAGAPAGSVIDRTTGVFRWSPTDAQSPSTNQIDVVVIDDGSPPLSATNTFEVVVVETNAQPRILGVLGSVTNTVFDAFVDVGVAGNPLEPGSTTVLPDGSIEMLAGGQGMWNGQDYIHFAYQEVSGDFDMSVKVESLQAVDFATSAGLMMRENLEPGSRHMMAAMVVAGPTEDGVGSNQGINQYQTYQREVDDGPISLWAKTPCCSSGVAYPNAWIRFQRQGQILTAYRSDDGLHWAQFSRTTAEPPFPARVLVGLWASSWNNAPGRSARVRWAQFQNVHQAFLPIPEQVIDEGAGLAFRIFASDPDVPAQRLLFSLAPEAPVGASIDPETGWFRWDSTEQDGPDRHRIRVRVTDSGVPPSVDVATFDVTVNEINSPPKLTPIPNQIAEATRQLSFTVVATDPDLPANGLTFSLSDGAPTGAAIDASTGAFTWIPITAQSPGTNTITIRVIDDGKPPLTDSKTFQVVVFGAAVDIQILGVPTLNAGRISFRWQAQAGKRYRIEFKESLDPTVPWKEHPNVITANADIGAFEEETDPRAGGRFYRVRME